MKAKNSIYLWVLAFVFLLNAGKAQAQVSSDSVLMNAMRDELARNFEALKADEGDDPFFIAYTIANAKNRYISASLGALNRSQEQRYKDWHVRLMVGDYEINDENFNFVQPQEAIFRPAIEMPVEDDYLGIRRSLWLTTNNVYFSAARSYKNKMALIRNKKISETDLQIDDFSRAPVVKKSIFGESPGFDQEKLEETARYLSGLFSNQAQIFSSAVTINAFESIVYFINTEGTEVRFPMNVITLTIQAGSMTDDSDALNKKLTYLGTKPEDLPSKEAIAADIKRLIANIMELRETPRFEGDYYGPVMIVGEVAAETLENFLFSGNDALIANRETLQSGSQQSVYYERNSNSLQTRMGKPVVSADLTITAEPYLKEYNGVPLFGSFEIDAEGVIPEEKLVLVEDGTLKTLLNGRTPTREVPNSNGHMRLDYSLMGLNKQVGPGVIRIQATNTVPYDSMKNELIRLAREQGEEHAMMIKSLGTGGSDKPFNYYLVDVNTGEEKLTRSVRLSNLTMQSLRRSPLFSDTVIVHNTLLSTQQRRSGEAAGIPSSFILPGAMLLRDVEMESNRKPLTSQLPILENPVGLDKPAPQAVRENDEE